MLNLAWSRCSTPHNNPLKPTVTPLAFARVAPAAEINVSHTKEDTMAFLIQLLFSLLLAPSEQPPEDTLSPGRGSTEQTWMVSIWNRVEGRLRLMTDAPCDELRVQLELADDTGSVLSSVAMDPEGEALLHGWQRWELRVTSFE